MPPISSERRRRPRISTMMLCEIRQGGGEPQLVRVRHLSECGLKIASKSEFTIGDRVWVRLPGAEEWALARVAWQTTNLVGLAFTQAVELPRPSGERDGTAMLASVRTECFRKSG